MTGHVTAAKARSKGDSDSHLTVAFDKLNVTNGKQLSVKGTVQAVFPPAEEADPVQVRWARWRRRWRYVGSTAGYRPMNDSKSGSNMIPTLV